MEGETSFWHRRRVDWSKSWANFSFGVPQEEYANQSFDIHLLSYVGLFIKADAIRKVGMVNLRYFIYFDDSEHSFRLLRYGRIVCFPRMVYKHDDGDRVQTQSITATWRDYYATRNEIHILKKYRFKKAVRMTRYFIDNIRKYNRGEENAFSNRDSSSIKLFKTVVIDAWLGRLGAHRLYKLGVKG